MKQFLFLVLSFCCMANVAFAEVAAADVKISRVDLQRVGTTNFYRCSVDVFSHNDDDAQDVNLHILLPLEARVTQLSNGCWAGPLMGSSARGTVVCKLGQMAVNATKSATLTFLALPSAAGYIKSCGAFVWSAVPDPDHSNNFAQDVNP